MCLCINLSAVAQHRLQYTHTIPFVTFRWLARSFMSFESKTWTIKRKCRENCTRNGKQNKKKKMGKNTTRWIETERQEKEMHVFLVFSVESESLEMRTHTHIHRLERNNFAELHKHVTWRALSFSHCCRNECDGKSEKKKKWNLCYKVSMDDISYNCVQFLLNCLCNGWPNELLPDDGEYQENDWFIQFSATG